MMNSEEIKGALNEMHVSTARGRAELLGQAIDLGPKPYEVESASRSRADGYIEISRRLSELVQSQRAGIQPDELEAVEWIRESFHVMARKVYSELAMRG